MFKSLVMAALLASACQKDKPKALPTGEFVPVELWVERPLPTIDGEQKVEFENVGDIGLVPVAFPEIVPTLIGGQPANPADWPATFYSSQGNSRCTATLIGIRTLQIAAHCVGNGRTASFKTQNNVQYTSTCKHAPGYNGNSTADWALCLVNQDVQGVPAEVLNQDPSYVKVGDKVLLTGFGCTNPGGGGGNDGTYRIGEATVQKVPSGSNNDIVTKGGAALCFGDSGGPAFKVEGQARKVISVNSRGDIRIMSYLSSVSTDEAKRFYASWSQENVQKICGVHQDAPGCRGQDPGPQPPPLPPQCRVELDKLNQCLYGQPRLAISKPDECDQTFSNLFACVQAAKIAE